MREIETLEQLRDWMNESPRTVAAVQGLDLTAHVQTLRSERFAGCLFLGCRVDDQTAGHLVNGGAIFIAEFSDLAFTVHRASLYTPEDLFAGFELDDPTSGERTVDHTVYKQYVEQGAAAPPSIRVSLARRLHDHSITDALRETLQGHKVVAIMGGHGMERGDPMYAAVARISRQLTRAGYLMISGGGPGAMEATHLGAYVANFDDDTRLDDALATLTPRPAGAEPGKEYADPDWLHRAMRVRAQLPLPKSFRWHSVGIPTWHYGHEPPAAFATKIAKYFANSVREEGLLAVANHGVVFSPGSAGTTQEVFQDAAQNHYSSYGGRAPMMFLGVEHWTKTRPIWPLLKHVARGKAYDDLLLLTDDEHEVVQWVSDFDVAAHTA